MTLNLYSNLPYARYEEDTMLNERLGINVKKYRKAKWMMQEQLANSSGISLTEIRAIERFRANPSLNTVELVAKALGVSPLDLLK